MRFISIVRGGVVNSCKSEWERAEARRMDDRVAAKVVWEGGSALEMTVAGLEDARGRCK